MSSKTLLDAFQRLGVRLDSLVQFKFGSGVTPKTSAVLVTTVVAMAAIAILMPEAPSKLPIIYVITGTVALYLFGTWIHTAVSPQTALEGGQLVAWQRAALGAKGYTTPELTVAAIPNPAGIEPPSEGGDDA